MLKPLSVFSSVLLVPQVSVLPYYILGPRFIRNIVSIFFPLLRICVCFSLLPRLWRSHSSLNYWFSIFYMPPAILQYPVQRQCQSSQFLPPFVYYSTLYRFKLLYFIVYSCTMLSFFSFLCLFIMFWGKWYTRASFFTLILRSLGNDSVISNIF